MFAVDPVQAFPAAGRVSGFGTCSAATHSNYAAPLDESVRKPEGVCEIPGNREFRPAAVSRRGFGRLMVA
jgi:hypothetical protein